MASNKLQGVQFIEIGLAEAGQRIDNFLFSLEKGVPKSRIYRALRKGEVRVNKRRIRQTYKIQAGDVIRIPPLRVAKRQINQFVSDTLKQQIIDNIVFEDEVMLVINKLAGLAVHAGSQIRLGLIEALRLVRPENNFLELVHRLDRETSGCLMIAKNRETLLNLQQQMQSHQVDKHYLTLLKGRFKKAETLIEQPLVKSTASFGERIVKVDATGKKAKTLFITQQVFNQAQLVKVKLFTGRTHQIRVHAAWSHHPVAGDDKYGSRTFNKQMKAAGLNRLFLHAEQLGIQHPVSGEKLILKAALPQPLQYVIDRLSA